VDHAGKSLSSKSALASVSVGFLPERWGGGWIVVRQLDLLEALIDAKAQTNALIEWLRRDECHLSQR